MAKLTQLIANFETQLASTINVGGVSGSLKTPVKDDDGVSLPNGLYIMAFNLGESNEEHLSFTLNASTGEMTNIKSISRQGVETIGATKQHRTGSKASVTDFANLLFISNILKGLDTLDGNTPLKYDTDPTITDDKQLVTKKYVDGVAIAGGVDSSYTTKGITERATSSEIDNGSSSGSSGPLGINPSDLANSKYNKFKTTPSDTNKVLTESEIYTDGISNSQLTQNANIGFGQTAGTVGNFNKLYLSYIPTKETIKSIYFKKMTSAGTPASNITINLYADNAGTPNTSSVLATVTISAAVWNAITDGNNYEWVLSSVLNVTKNATYWLEFSQATPSDTNYPKIAYQNTAITGYSIKKYNTPDGMTNVTGAIYIKVIESKINKIQQYTRENKQYEVFTSSGTFTPTGTLDTVYKITAVAGYNTKTSLLGIDLNPSTTNIGGTAPTQPTNSIFTFLKFLGINGGNGQKGQFSYQGSSANGGVGGASIFGGSGAYGAGIDGADTSGYNVWSGDGRGAGASMICHVKGIIDAQTITVGNNGCVIIEEL